MQYIHIKKRAVDLKVHKCTFIDKHSIAIKLHGG